LRALSTPIDWVGFALFHSKETIVKNQQDISGH
jgi:hypothetical protein